MVYMKITSDKALDVDGIVERMYQALSTKSTVNNNKNIDVTLEIKITSYSDLKRAVKNLSEIQKEYSCNCTLFAETNSALIRD